MDAQKGSSIEHVIFVLFFCNVTCLIFNTPLNIYYKQNRNWAIDNYIFFETIELNHQISHGNGALLYFSFSNNPKNNDLYFNVLLNFSLA